MTKYMAAGRVPGPRRRSRSRTRARGSRASPKSGQYGGKIYGVPYYAGSRVITYRTDLFKAVNAKIPTSRRGVLRARQEARGEELGEDLLACLHRRHGLVLRDELRRTTTAARSPMTNKGKWIGTLDRPKALAGLAAFKRFFDAASRASKTTDEVRPNPYDVYAQGNAASIHGAGLVQLLRRRLQEPHGAVRDAEPHQGPADSGLPRRLGPRGPGRCQQGAGSLLDLAPSPTTRR